MNQNSKFTQNPEGVNLGEVKEYTSRRKKISELVENDENVEILATVVQSFEPRFFEVCPQCNRRTRPDGSVFRCAEHGEITPAFSYVMNVVVDDGTDNMRVVCFKNQAKVLMGKEDEEVLALRQNPADFENVKQELLGAMVKLVGRVTKNTMFDRLEFVSQMVFRDPKP